MQPLLGTFVSIRIALEDPEEAHAAIDRGFAAIARIHRLMSFHEPTSDVSRLNRAAWREAVDVDTETMAVLSFAQRLAQASDGRFDISVGGALVARGLLPRPEKAPEPDAAASWRDIELTDDGRVRFARPLWIDLGGIAKGYAVDRAMIALDPAPQVQCLVNAGGDLRVSGPGPEPVRLGLDMSDAVPMVELENGSLASSTGAARWGAARGAHVNGVTGRTVGARSFASVAATSCMVADALTKVVLAMGRRATGILRAHDAIAYLYSAPAGWRILGG